MFVRALALALAAALAAALPACTEVVDLDPPPDGVSPDGGPDADPVPPDAFLLDAPDDGP